MTLTTILSTSIFGNNVLQYIYFIGLLLLTLIVAKIVYLLFTKVFRLLAKKTKSKLDDLLIIALQKPVLFGIFIGGLHYSRTVFILTEKMNTIYSQTIEILVILAVTWFIQKFIDALLVNYIRPLTQKSSSKTDNTIYPLAKKTVTFIIYAIAFVLIIQTMGFQVTGLVAGLGIGGLAFALAAKDILANLFGGAAIISDKPFKIGDRIKVDSYDGFVSKIGLRSTVLTTFSGTNIILPNSKVADNYIENISREDARRVKFILGVEYSTSSTKLEKAKKILADIIKKNSSTDDKSLVHFKEFGPSSLDLQLIYWIKDLDNILGAQDEVNFAIKKAFEKEKIEFAYPSQTVYVKK